MQVAPTIFPLPERSLVPTSPVPRSAIVQTEQPLRSSETRVHRRAMKYRPPRSPRQNRSPLTDTSQVQRSAHSNFVRNGRISTRPGRLQILVDSLSTVHSEQVAWNSLLTCPGLGRFCATSSHDAGHILGEPVPELPCPVRSYLPERRVLHVLLSQHVLPADHSHPSSAT